MLEMSQQIHRYYVTVDRSSLYMPLQKVRAPKDQSEAVSSKLPTRYLHNRKSKPVRNPITKNCDSYIIVVLVE